ncbi:hypothetical protein STFR1_30125 [Bacillus vallismortis]
MRKIEKITPKVIDSKNSAPVTQNTGNKNINAPVLIKIGGRMIFFGDTGLSEDFILTTITATAINTARIDETIIIIFIIPLFLGVLILYTILQNNKKNHLKRNDVNVP